MSEQNVEKRLLRPQEVRKVLGGIARATLHKYRNKEDFPDSVRIDGVVGFWNDEIQEFAESHRQSSE